MYRGIAFQATRAVMDGALDAKRFNSACCFRAAIFRRWCRSRSLHSLQMTRRPAIISRLVGMSIVFVILLLLWKNPTRFFSEDWMIPLSKRRAI